MNHYRKPTSVQGLLRLLQSTVQQAGQTDGGNGALLAKRTVTAVEALLPNFAEADQAVRQAEAERRDAMVAADATLVPLMMAVRNLRLLLRRQVRQGTLAPGILSFYAIPLTGRVSDPHRRADWLALAEQLLAGHAQALAAGYPAAVDPAALEAATAAMRGTLDRLQQADAALQELRAGRTTLRDRAFQLSDEVLSELRFRLRNKPRPYVRQILRAYGLVASRRQGEEMVDGGGVRE